MESDLEISPVAAQKKLNDSKKTILVDVREPDECALARLETAEYIPMGLIPAALPRLEELAKTADLLVLCHHGVRSLQVVAWLRERGLANCYSVTGGIDRWSWEVDPSVPRY